MKINRIERHMSHAQIMALGFFLVIVIGTAILVLPLWLIHINTGVFLVR